MRSPRTDNTASLLSRDDAASLQEQSREQQPPTFLVPTNLELVNDDHGQPIANLYKQKDDAKYFWRNPGTGELTELNHSSNGMLRILSAGLQVLENARIRTIALITILLMFMVGYKAKVENNGKTIEEQLTDLQKLLQNATLSTMNLQKADGIIDRARVGAIETRHTMTILSIILLASGIAGTLRRSAAAVSENSTALINHGGYMILAALFGIGGLGMGTAASINSAIAPNNKFNYLWLNHLVQNETLLPLVYLTFAIVNGFAFEGVCYFAGKSHRQEAIAQAGVFNTITTMAKNTKNSARMGWATAANTLWGGSPADMANRFNRAYDNNRAAAAIDAAQKTAPSMA